MTAHILIVDDDAPIRDVLRMALEDAGLTVAEAQDGAAALALLPSARPDLIILDIGMPELDGLETCREVRKTSDVPILFLTARDDEIDRVLSFELGGDDHVTKPFSPRELVLRVRAILKRQSVPSEAQEKLSFADLTMVPSSHSCTLGGINLPLTGTEYGVLKTLLGGSARVFTRNQLIEAVYGPNTSLSDRTLDSHLRNIRQKAQALGYGDVIETVHGVGVRLGTCQR